MPMPLPLPLGAAQDDSSALRMRNFFRSLLLLPPLSVFSFAQKAWGSSFESVTAASATMTSVFLVGAIDSGPDGGRGSSSEDDKESAIQRSCCCGGFCGASNKLLGAWEDCSILFSERRERRPAKAELRRRSRGMATTKSEEEGRKIRTFIVFERTGTRL